MPGKLVHRPISTMGVEVEIEHGLSICAAVQIPSSGSSADDEVRLKRARVYASALYYFMTNETTLEMLRSLVDKLNAQIQTKETT